VAVVVVVGLQRVQAAGFSAEPGGRLALDESAAGSLEQAHRRTAVEIRGHDVEPAVAVEVVHDDAAGHRDGVNPARGATSTKRPTSSLDSNAAGGSAVRRHPAG
jgi:hypothetical protein